MLKCDDDVIGINTASMHRGFRPEEDFLCCMCAMTANRLYYQRILKYKELQSLEIGLYMLYFCQRIWLQKPQNTKYVSFYHLSTSCQGTC
jgi:hypothetical protein